MNTSLPPYPFAVDSHIEALWLLADFVIHQHDGWVEVFPQNCPSGQLCIRERLNHAKPEESKADYQDLPQDKATWQDDETIPF